MWRLVGAMTLGLLWGAVSFAETQRMLKLIVTPPADFSTEDQIHVVGTFNQWDLTGDKAKPMHWQDGQLVADIPLNGQVQLFNLVKNQNWSHLAATASGKSTCGVLLPADEKRTTLELELQAWMGEPAKLKATKTTTGNIQLLADFAMPQLGRKTDIQVYLPPGYSEDLPQAYPVLYMLDGQNVFDESTAYSNEWRVDEHLQRMIPQQQLPAVIVVAIGNSPRRWFEYNPWDFVDNQGVLQHGEGEQSFKFIKQTLKPYIDQHFNTRKDPASTGFAGSSLGGLMAIYAAMAHSDTFGYVAAFSPSLGVENKMGDNVLFTALEQYSKPVKGRIYLDMGRVEYGSYRPVEKLYQLLREKGAAAQNLQLVKDDLGRHCEKDWSKRFPAAMQWLMQTQGQ